MRIPYGHNFISYKFLFFKDSKTVLYSKLCIVLIDLVEKNK